MAALSPRSETPPSTHTQLPFAPLTYDGLRSLMDDERLLTVFDLDYYRRRPDCADALADAMAHAERASALLDASSDRYAAERES